MVRARMVPSPESSTVVAFGYDREAETLLVEFIGGRAYAYSRVPESVFLEMYSAASIGTFLNTKIKGHFAYQPVVSAPKVEAAEAEGAAV